MRLLPALGLALALAGCGGGADHRGDPSLRAELRLSPTPPMVGTAGVAVDATDGGIQVVPPGRVTAAVRGTPARPTALEFDEGAWVGSLEFPEPGDVRVELSITAADGRSATLTLPVRVVRRP